MLFSLTNTPTTFQALINNTLRKRLNLSVLAYLDNILVFTKDPDINKYIKQVTQVLEQLQEKGLRANPDKCEFYKEEVVFLGY